MINLSDIDDVRALQSNVRSSLGTPQGQEVIKFLEAFAGWYDFKDTHPDIIQIKHGRRQLLATIKTLLDCTPEQIVALAKQEEQ